MIDPQLQGIKWIKQKYGDDLRVIRIGQRGYLDVIENAISSGDTVLIENMEESIDPVLDPVLGRNTIKKGRWAFDMTWYLLPGHLGRHRLDDNESRNLRII